MTLKREPAFKLPTLITDGSRGGNSRLTADCRFMTKAEAVTTASIPWCGAEP